jgi:FtsX-like permease family protein
VNITSLLVVRASKRQREFAVRLAIGAGRGRLARQLFVETTMLFFAGTVAGVVCASWVTRALAVFLSSGSRPILLDVHWDSRVLGFTAALSLLVSLVFGAAPILRAMRTDPHMAMKDGSRASASRGRMEQPSTGCVPDFLIADSTGWRLPVCSYAAQSPRHRPRLPARPRGTDVGPVDGSRLPGGARQNRRVEPHAIGHPKSFGPAICKPVDNDALGYHGTQGGVSPCQAFSHARIRTASSD